MQGDESPNCTINELFVRVFYLYAQFVCECELKQTQRAKLFHFGSDKSKQTVGLTAPLVLPSLL